MNPTILAIDVGNTRIKWGMHDGARWIDQRWIATQKAGELKAEFASLTPQKIVISNVVGAMVGEQLLATLPADVTPLWIKSERSQCGVQNSYHDPAQLGCDRWAALVAAHSLGYQPALVINAGTALTVDALTKESVFIGGIIVPGVDLMRRALADRTASLNLQPGRFDSFPKSTGDAIAGGIIDAACGAIERMARYLEELEKTPPLCVLSGGSAQAVSPYLNLQVKLVDNLVLEGLRVIAQDAHGAHRQSVVN